MKRLLVMLVLVVAALSISANAASAQRRPPGAGPLRIFVDCDAIFGCDLDYLRTEIPYVDYMRDRTDASIHVLLSQQATGSGGTEYTFNFIGLRDFAGMTDTLKYVSLQTATDDDRRKGFAQTLKVGLVRFIARTPGAERLQISFSQPAAGAAKAAEKAHDPWNFWVFRTRANGNFSGESSQRFINVNGSISANRITKEWKISNSISVNYNESKFTFNEGEVFRSYSRGYGASQLVAKSLTDHWSVGERSNLSSSTYLNMKRSLRFAPAIEYNVFPYSQSTRKMLALQYSIGVNSYRYRDTTIFEKTSEVRPNHALVASISTTQPWGSVSSSIEGSSYLDDLSKRRFVMFQEVNARLFKGFSFNMYGGLSLLRDQIYLAKGGATDEEILLQRKQLATSYSYFAGVGLTYTFGSIFNNVVNPRFQDGGGTFVFY